MQFAIGQKKVQVIPAGRFLELCCGLWVQNFENIGLIHDMIQASVFRPTLRVWTISKRIRYWDFGLMWFGRSFYGRLHPTYVPTLFHCHDHPMHTWHRRLTEAHLWKLIVISFSKSHYTSFVSISLTDLYFESINDAHHCNYIEQYCHIHLKGLL